MKMENETQAIKIGGGKYLLLIKWHGTLRAEHGEIANQITEGLEEWWKGDEKFLSISLGDDVDITFERAK
jgi:hypothetical protein